MGEPVGNWKAGVASVVITPDQPVWMAGYASRSEPGKGVLTDLKAKALALEDVGGDRGVVVTLDLVGIDRLLSDWIRDELKRAHDLERSQVMICTSHTHSGPVVHRNLSPLHYWLVDQGQKKLIEGFALKLRDQVVGVVGRALEDLKPAKLQWGSGRTTFAVNRRNNKPYDKVPEWRAGGELKGPVDHDVPVLSVRGGGDGALRAVLFGYACHATTLAGQQWCGDYPGYAQLAVESANPGCTALFWAGCGGDQNPLPRRTVDLAREYGGDLARAVGDVLDAPMPVLPSELNTAYREIDLPLAHLPTAAELDRAEASGNRYEVARAKLLKREIKASGALRDHYPYPVAVWNLGGEIEFVFLGGEVVVDYALRLKRGSSGRRTWVAAYSNDVMAYIPSLRVLKEGGYEGGGSNVYYGLPGLWAEGVEEDIVTAARELSGETRGQ